MSSLAENRPRFTTESACRIAGEIYGLTCTARELSSERDQNFLLEDPAARRLVLKIASAAERPEVLDLQNRAMEHLSARLHRYVFPRPVVSTNGQKISHVHDNDGRGHYVRLLGFLEGRLMADVRPHGIPLLRELGKLYGAIDREFQDFGHPAAGRELVWDMSTAHRVIRRNLWLVRDEHRLALLGHFLGQFEARVLPRLESLRAGIIHNDGNDHNVLVGRPSIEAGGIREAGVLGVIDFGDMLRSHPVCDLAIVAAYALLGKKDPVTAACAVVSGYHEEWPLTDAELEVLPVLIGIRLATSVAVSARQQAHEPENRYLSVSEAPAWEALERLALIDQRQMVCSFRAACGLTPCPHSVAVVEWLKQNRDHFAPVIEAELRPPLAAVIDLSPGSLRMSDPTVLGDVSKFSLWVDNCLAHEGAKVGIGRYNEARLAYSGGQFRVERDGFAEARTVHIGIDLFSPAGTPVFAPLEGIVHSYWNNNLPGDYGPTVILEHRAGSSGGPFFTLFGHLSVESLEGLEKGRPVHRGERIGWMGDESVNGGWPPHLHFQIISDMLGREGDFPGVAAPSERTLWLSLCPDPNLVLGIPEKMLQEGSWDSTRILDSRGRHLSRALSLSYRRPLHIVRGFMQYLYDADGSAFLDAVNNVPHVGHSHPKVVRALQEQAAVLNTNTRYLHANVARYAERLCSLLPNPLRICFFVNSGSEANDLALRLARTHTGRRDVVVVAGGYHGNLTSLVEISPYKFDGPGGRGAPNHVHKVPVPDLYKGLYRSGDPGAALRYAAHLDAGLESARNGGGGAAAFICESILSCAGQIVLPPGYLVAAYDKVRAAGGVCIADEVQVGFGRVGEHFWGFELQGVVPDIVTMGKPIGNGHPLGAVVTTPEIAASFVTGMEYFNTYGGNPVSAAVGLSVLDVIEDEGLQGRAFNVGRRLASGLEELKGRHPLVGDVRGRGLFLGVELVRDHESLAPAGNEAAYLAERMRDSGILVSTDGPHHNVLKIKPPLVFAESDADSFVETLDALLDEDAVQG